MVSGISLWFVIFLILGIIAIVVGVIKNEPKYSSTFWFLTALWVLGLSMLYH